MNVFEKYIQEKFDMLDFTNDFWVKNRLCFKLQKNIDDGELVYNEFYLRNVYKRAVDIFKDLYKEDDEVIFLVTKAEYKDELNYSNDSKGVRIRQYIKDRSKIGTINSISQYLLDEKEYEYLTYYFVKCKVSQIKYRILFDNLIRQDLGWNYKNLCDYYIIHTKNNYIFRLCDDEYLDIVCKDEEDMKKIKEKYKCFYDESE